MRPAVAALLTELRHGHGDLLDERTVVVDEAAMLGTRPLAELADARFWSQARAGW